MTTVVMDHLEYLSAQVGARPLGSPANLAAGEYIARTLANLGLAVEEQTLPCPLWEADALLELPGEALPALANTWSPSCDVTAPVAALGTLAELEAGVLEGRIAVLYGELTRDHGHGARSAFYCPEESRKVIRLLEEKRPAAVLTISPNPGCPERLIRDWEFPLPSATVMPEAGMRLFQSAGQPPHLRITARQSPGRFVNVVARQAGRRPERIVLLAHFDTQADTPGAADNASGAAVLLALAARFARADLAYGLEWLAVNGEEAGGVGDAVYLQQRGDTLGQVLVAVNVDGVGQVLGPTSIVAMGGSPALQDAVGALRARYAGVIRVEPWYASDHSAFFFQGVPCVALSSVGLSNTHMPSDTVDWVSSARLEEVVELVAALLAELGDRPVAWFRE